MTSAVTNCAANGLLYLENSYVSKPISLTHAHPYQLREITYLEKQKYLSVILHGIVTIKWVCNVRTRFSVNNYQLSADTRCLDQSSTDE